MKVNVNVSEAEDRPQTEVIHCASERPPAAYLLQRRIEALRGEADGLEALLNQLPRILTPAADEALWNLLHR